MKEIKIGIVTASDRASAGVYDDISGPAITNTLNDYIKSAWQAVPRLIPDDQHIVEQTLIDLSDNEQCCLIITTGGTGPSPRDMVPEATESVCDKMMPGFGELMRQESLKYVPTAILSRQTAGLRNSTLIINLPGKPKAIRQCLDAVFPAVPYCIDLINGPYIEANDNVISVFRPAQK